MKGVRKSAVIIFVSWLLSGCLGTRYLQENEKLLFRQNIEAPRKFNKAPLNDLYLKEVNRRLLGLPVNTLVWMHHEGEKHYDKQKFIDKKAAYIRKYDHKIASAKNQKKITRFQYRRQQKIDAMNSKIENGNNFMQWGEAAAVYDSSVMEATKERFKDYLFTKGYFQNTVTYRTQEYKKRVSVTYEVKPGAPYIYDTLFYEIPDPHVMALITADRSNSLIKLYSQYDQDKLNKERERIDFFLKDHGYFDFSRQYVEYAIDTSFKAGHRLALQIRINNPGQKSSHTQFKLDSVIFTTDAAVNARDNLKRQSTPYRQITFQYFNDQYSKKLLAQRVFIQKDSLYNRTSTLTTQRQLANLDIFKFININYDTSGGKFIANVFSSPLDRYSWSNEAGMTVTQGFPGPYYSTSFKKRNVFRGLEIVEINGRFGFEGVASATRVGNFYKSTDASINGSITFPQFLLPMKENSAFKIARYNPRTRLLAGYAYTDRPEYQRSTTTISNTYTWENKQITRYSLTLINLNIIRSKLDNAFDSLLTYLQENQGNNLKNSFKPSFVSSMIFSVTWNPHNYGNTERTSYIIRFQAETGGTFFNFATPGYIVRRGLELYKFVRFNVDARRSQVLSKNSVLAFRINAGAGYSYNTNEVLPYEKYFFVGGSNSVRAWRPRRLGVGSSPPELATDPHSDGLFDYRFEKPGEILLEGSIEARRKLFAFVNGAIFLDFGNVWSFREIQLSSETSGTKANWQGSTKFDSNFYKQLGVGTGFGLRFDFSFLVLRIDAGIKVYDPGRADGDRFVLDKFKFFKPFGTNKEPVIYNVGIGYPF